MSLRVSHENQVLQNGGRNIGGAASSEDIRGVSNEAIRLARNIRYMNVGDTFTGKITGIDGQAERQWHRLKVTSGYTESSKRRDSER